MKDHFSFQHKRVGDLVRLNTFELIKVASDTAFDMINFVYYYDKPLILIGAIPLRLSRLFLTLH